MKALDSPDELEALEVMNETIDSSIIDKGGTIDIDSLKAWGAAEGGLSPMSPRSDDSFKLRYDIKKYKRRMSSSSQSSQHDDDDIWVKMPAGRTRGRSLQYAGHRPLSAELPTHPHFSKLPLARSSSETFKLVDDIHKMNLRAHSDPNILDTQTDKDSESSKDGRDARLLDSSISTSTLGASDEFSVSSASSHEENLLDSVNSAFNRLGKKYRLQSGGMATEEENVHDDNRTSRRDVRKTKKTHFAVGDSDLRESDHERNGQRTEANVEVSVTNVDEPKRTVHKLAREFSRRARSLERPSTLMHRHSEPFIDSKNQREEDRDTGDKLAMTTQPRGDLAKKVQSLQQALSQSQQKTSHVDANADVFHAIPVTVSSESSPSDEDQNHEATQSEPRVARQPSVRKKSVRDQVSQYECLSPKRSMEGKVVTPNAGLTIQQRLRTIQETCDNNNRRSKSMDRSHFEERRTSPSTSRTGSPLKTLRERKIDLDDWLARPVPHGRYKSEGAFLGMAYSDTMSNSSGQSDERDQVFSARSSRTSSVQSSESPSPRLSRSSMSRQWSSNSSSLSEEDAVLFKSIKDRFRELEVAATKPVPRTCKDAREEIKAIAQAERHHKDMDSKVDPNADVYHATPVTVSSESSPSDEDQNCEATQSEPCVARQPIDTEQQTPEQDAVEDSLPPVDIITAETDSSMVTQETETVSVQIESHAQEDAQSEISIELKRDDVSGISDVEAKISVDSQDVATNVQDISPEVENSTELTDAQDKEEGDEKEQEHVAEATSGDGDTLKRTQAEELMRQLNLLTLSNGAAAGTLKRSPEFSYPESGLPGQDQMDTGLPQSNSIPPVDDQMNFPSSITNTKDLPIEDEPASSSTQYSLDEDLDSIEHTHLMDHNYRSTSDDSYVSTRVTKRVAIDRDTRSEGGLSPERKPLSLERILSNDSNIFMDAKSELGGSEDSSSQSGFVTPVESFSQE